MNASIDVESKLEATPTDAVSAREQQLMEANGLLRMLCAVYQVLASGYDEALTAQQICRSVVEEAEFGLAFVVLRQPAAAAPFIAYWSDVPCVLAGPEFDAATSEAGRGPLETVERCGRHMSWQLGHTDQATDDWRDWAQAGGYASSLTVPVRLDGSVIGTLTVMANHANAFNAALIDCLGEVTTALEGGIRAARAESARQSAVLALQKNKATLDVALANMPDAVFFVDVGGRVIDCNDAFATFHRFSSKEECPQSLAECADIIEVREINCAVVPVENWAVQRALRGEIGRNVEFALRRKDSDDSWFGSYCFAPIRDEGGAVVGAVVSGRDITSLKQREIALERANKQLRLAQRAAGAGIWDFDIVTGSLTWSDEMFALLGLNAEYTQPSVETFLSVLHPDDRGAACQNSEASIRDRIPLRAQYRVQLPRNGLRWIDSMGDISCDEDGQPTNLSGICIDATTRKTAEIQLQQHRDQLETEVHQRTLALAAAKDAAEASSRSKSAFLANTSHEIRSPMNAIIGLTHLLRRDTPEGPQLERLNKVEGAAKHLLQVLNAILDLSKIEAGKMELEPQAFDLDTVLERVVNIVRPGAVEKGLELIVETGDLPRVLVGDQTKLAQMLINLLSNAIKFTSTGWVRVRARSVHQLHDRVKLRFEVQDTGPGVPEQKKTKLFEDFEQGDNSTTRRYGGTGLGLSLTRKFAELMNGTADVVSAAGKGSTFWFTAELEVAEGLPPAQSDPALRGLKALIVDDLTEARLVIVDQLRRLGIHVHSRPSGVSALSLLETTDLAGERFDILIVDLQMPSINGLEFMQRARSLLRSRVPPTVLTTKAESDVSVDSNPGAAVWLLSKPATASALASVLKIALGLKASKPGNQSLGDIEDELRRHCRGTRVLLAEDNPINREIAVELLESVGIIVESAADGERAVEMALSADYALVLMDVRMPVLDGLEATRQIRKALGSQLPILAITANAFAGDQMACLESGMNDHLAKPIDPERLFSALLTWLPRIESSSVTSTLGAERGDVKVLTDHWPKLMEQLARVDNFDASRVAGIAGGDLGRAVKLIAFFASQYCEGDADLLDASVRGDSAGVRQAAHSIRGACAALGAVAASDQALALETAGLEVDIVSLRSAANCLQDELQAIAGALARVVGIAA